jgi:hypothetical protein
MKSIVYFVFIWQCAHFAEPAFEAAPASNDAFRPPSPKKPTSQPVPRPPTGQPPAAREDKPATPALRYTKTPPAQTKEQGLDMWNQQESINTF